MPDPTLSTQPPNAFPATRWSMVRRAREDASDEAHSALAELCQTYWYPLYAFIRRRGNDVHDAQDLTQSFILEIIEGPLLERADPDKGRFRSFVLGALEHFLSNERRRQGAERRGGRTKIVSLDEARDEARLARDADAALPLEMHFERAWAFALLDAVLQRLGAEYAAAGKKPLFDALQPCLSAYRVRGSYAELSLTLGLSEDGVAAAMYRLRRRYAELLRAEISHTVSSPDEIKAELAHLQAVVAG